MNAIYKAALLFVFGAAVSNPRVVEAQGCGGACLPCQGAPSSAWKYGGLSGANFLAYCTPNSSCSVCNFTSESRSRREAEKLRVRLHNSSEQGLDDLVMAHGETLRMVPARSAVVLLGGCDGATPMSLSYLPPSKIDRLKQLGVRQLSELGATQVAMAR
jgi:hypothetical protein